MYVFRIDRKMIFQDGAEFWKITDILTKLSASGTNFRVMRIDDIHY